MIQNPPRRPSNVVPVLVLGFVVGVAAESAVDLALDFTITLTRSRRSTRSVRSSRSCWGWSSAA